MNDVDQLTTVRELLRDALEIARSAGSVASDAEVTAVWRRSREGIRPILNDLDNFATRSGKATLRRR